MKVTATYDIPALDVCSLVTSAMESGYSPWLHDLTLVKSKATLTKEVVWWGQETVFDHEFTIKAKFDDPEGEEGNGRGEMTFGNKEVETALAQMSIKAPHHFGNIMSGDADAITGDVLMQFILVGEIVYG